VKYGDTTVMERVILYDDAASQTSPMIGKIEGVIINAGSTSSQDGIVQINGRYEVGISGTPIVTSPSTTYDLWTYDVGTASEDSTVDKQFSVTGQFNNSSAVDTITITHSTLEIIR